jgi:type I site-specific restriction-modification system R (restriction) subunit
MITKVPVLFCRLITNDQIKSAYIVLPINDSKLLFGGYIHKYYYNQSIADDYTLRLFREEIKGNFKIEMKEVM